ncbi:hypothetical protein Y032_0233g3097 [Ancylostoma ceylanicum]|uniref:SXP/RAL-2 family protein Ani s 5-like cation-binding domain-containing protein n=1 Tax=Ancylostoma ceylanicum TaxID=53326 RepID=A0A016SG86_9BILA|nr:hypothetical protein Y032_0233g3097 [Ancylostoma ceylanicum]
MRATILLLCFGFAAAKPNGDMAAVTNQIQQTAVDPVQGVVNNGLHASDPSSMNFQPFHGTKDIRPEMQPMLQSGNQGIMTLNEPMHQNMVMTQPGISDRDAQQPRVQLPVFGNFSEIRNFLANVTSKIGEQISSGVSLLTHAGPIGKLLSNVSKEGVEEFMNITHSAENNTIAEMKTRMSEWASKNGLKEQFATFEANRNTHRTEIIANATMIVNSLPGLFQHLVSIIQNDQQSIKDLGNATDAYFRSLDPATIEIMSTITRVTGIDMLLFKIPRWNSNGNMGGFDLIKKLIGGGPGAAHGQMGSLFPQVSMFGERPMDFGMDFAEEHEETAGDSHMAHE